jgi:uncharacterized membrane protein
VEVNRNVTIDAPPAEVWAVFMDLEAWPTWTASMRQVRRLDEGPLQVGSRVEIAQPGFPKAVWDVTGLEPERSFTWENAAPGLRSAGHHEVRAEGAGSVVTLRLSQSGPLAGLVGLVFGRRNRRYVDLEADGLKARVESAPGA